MNLTALLPSSLLKIASYSTKETATMNLLKDLTRQEIKPEAQEGIAPLRKKLAELWDNYEPIDSPYPMLVALERYKNLYLKLDAANFTADHYLLLADTCKLANIELGCSVIRLTFKQGRSHDITTAYLISDLENIGQEAIEQVTGELVIKIPDEYKEILLSNGIRCTNRRFGSMAHIGIYYYYYNGSFDWHGIKNTLAKILDTKIRCLETDKYKVRKEYVESFVR